MQKAKPQCYEKRGDYLPVNKNKLPPRVEAAIPISGKGFTAETPKGFYYTMTKKLILLLAPIFLLACGLSRSAILMQADPIPSPTAAQIESPTTSPTHPQPTQQSTCTVSAESLHLRESAGVDGVVIGWLKADEVVTILHDQSAGNWIHIQADNLTGWINSNYCMEAP